MQCTVAEVARQVGGRVDGDETRLLTGMAGLRDAGEGDLSFFSNRRYLEAAEHTHATAVLVPEDWEHHCPAVLIKVPNPDAAFACLAPLFARVSPAYVPGVHPSAVIGEDCMLGEGVTIGPGCVLEPGAVIGDRTVLVAQVFVGRESRIGCDGLLYPQVSLREYVQLGDRIIVHNGTVIGSDGFGYTVGEDGARTKIPQLGTVIIGDDVEIGANVMVDRARFGQTRIGNGVKIDNLVQIAHNVVIGDHALIIAQVGISGSTSVGSRAILAGQSGIAGHLRIGEGAIVGAQAGVTKSVEPKSYVSGYPAMPHEKASRIHAHLMRLPTLKEAVKELEDRLERLEKNQQT